MKHDSNCQCSKFSLGLPEESLNGQIDTDSLQCFNELVIGSNKRVYQEKDNALCESEHGDPELVFVIWFQECVSIKSIFVQSAKDKQPSGIKIHINRENMSYDIVNEKPVQIFKEIHWSPKDQTELLVNPVAFQKVNTIALQMNNESLESVGVSQIVFKGISSGNKRGIVRAEYEIVNTGDSQVQQEINQLHLEII